MQRRKRKLVRLDVQIRVACIALVVASLVVFLNFHLSVSAVAAKAAELRGSANAALVADEIWRTIMVRSFISLGIAIPLSIAVAFVYSFNFAGPIYRFKQYFSGLKEGRWDQPCRLRQGDDLQDISEAINFGLDSIRTLLRENRAILGEARDLLGRGADAREEAGERVQSILARIDAAEAIHAVRFPAEGIAGGRAAPPASGQAAEGDSESATAKQLELQA